MNDTPPNSWLPRPLRVAAGRALETALNHVLELDPASHGRLADLDGRRIELHLRGPELVLAVDVQGGRLRVGPPGGETQGGRLQLAATPGGLLAMLLRRGGDGAAAAGRVDIAGDAELARRLERLASQFAPDFEEAFARRFGDVLGVPLARAVRRGMAHARESASHLAEDGADWLREEARLAVPPAELEGFLDGVDALRERSERLASRLARLERRLGGAAA